MIVLDASAAVEWLLQSADGRRVNDRVASETVLHAPELLDLEVVQAVRGFSRSHSFDPSHARRLLEDFVDLPLILYPHRPLVVRTWELRANLTAYDAAYVALAESLDATLLTCDARLAAAPGNNARIQLI